MTPGLLADFVAPTTKDFVWPCWGGGLRILGFSFCLNFVMFLVLLSFTAFLLLFYLAFRKPQIVPSGLQNLMEVGILFVRDNIARPMIGPEGDRFMPLLATLFFFIFLGNILEVVPGINLSANSRIAFPLTLAIVSWVTFNVVGIKQHGFIGYLKHVMLPPGAPLLAYLLLVPIEFITQIVVRPITLSVRLAANLLAGHFLLAVFFLGTIALLQSGILAIVGVFAFVLSVVLVGFEIFVSILQAFIFAILTASYIGGAMAEEH